MQTHNCPFSIGDPENFNFGGERRLKLPVHLAERYGHRNLLAERDRRDG